MTCAKICLKIHRYNPISIIFTVLSVSKENAFNLLEKLILLYLLIWNDSFAKDIKEIYKMKSKKSKKAFIKINNKESIYTFELWSLMKYIWNIFTQ